MNQEKIGKFISQSRKAKKLTQESLAESLGVNHRTISRWENGKNMPDVSLYKPLCEILEISIEELINGEKTKKNELKESYEKAITNTIDNNHQNKKKFHKIIIILTTIILIISIILLLIIIYYKNKYPKIDIYNLSILNSDKLELNKEITIDKGNYKIWFYGIDSLQLSDSKNNYYDLKSALKYNQIKITDIKDYLDSQHNNEYIEKYLLYDGGTIIYKSKKYEIIFCNTIDNNNDIYIGTPNITTNLKGAYCGHTEDNNCYFTRTYHILNIQEDDDYNFINVTLKQFQSKTSLVKIPRIDNLQVGKNYEFTFRTYESFDDSIENIFKLSTIIEVKETNKQGLEQTSDKICISN